MAGFLVEKTGNNIFLTYKIAQEEGIDKFARGMLENNEIQHVLPLSLLNMDGEKKIRFNVTGYTTLEEIRHLKVSKKMMLNLLNSFVAMQESLEEHMLGNNGLQLERRYVFVEQSTGKAYFVYLPLTNGEEKEIVPFVKELLYSFQYDGQENSQYVYDILQPQVTTLDGIKSILLEAEGYQRNDKDKVPDFSAVHHENDKNLQTPPQADHKEEKESDSGKRGLFGTGRKKKSKAIKETAVNQPPVQEYGFAVPNQAEPFAIPTPIAQVRQEASEEEAQEAPRQSGKWAARQKERQAAKLAAKQAKESRRAKKQISQAAVEATPPAPMASSPATPPLVMPMQAEPMRVEPVRVESVRMGPPQQAILIQCRTGMKIHLSQDLIRIGKQQETVECCITDNPTISRRHAGFIREKNHYYVVDYASLNHTYVNEERLIPNQRAELKNGDVIRISDEEFIFKIIV